jgi:tetratricopeptide (TPR) repeat protein
MELGDSDAFVDAAHAGRRAAIDEGGNASPPPEAGVGAAQADDRLRRMAERLGSVVHQVAGHFVRPGGFSAPTPPRPLIEANLRSECFGAATIMSAHTPTHLSILLSDLGRFDEAIGHAEAAVRIAEAADHPFTLHFGLLALGSASRGSFAVRVLERGIEVCRTWHDVVGTPVFAATLGVAYVLAGRTDEAASLAATAVEEFRRLPLHFRPACILLCAGMISISLRRIDEAAGHAREPCPQPSFEVGQEAHALCLTGDVALARGDEDAEGYYRHALVLAGRRGMRPLVAHCHLDLGKMQHRMGNPGQAQEHLTIATAMYREMGMAYWLEQAESEMGLPG